MSNDTSLQAVALALDAAALEQRTVRPFAEVATLEQGYAVQDILIGLRLQRGSQVIGRKMGLTSRAKMQQMGVHAPIYGTLTSEMARPDGSAIACSGLIHPKIEPEICFRLGRDLRGAVSFDEAVDAIEAAAAALEIIDSRFVDFKYDLPNVIADNASGACFALGRAWVPLSDVDTADLDIRLEIDGHCVERASSSAVYDHPVRSLMALSEMLGERGLQLSAGMVILTGAATAAVPVRPGQQVRALIEGLGSVSVSFS